ncbi:Rhamnogalacturonase B, N-terminal-domain-containing protein [Dendryphion nanum]|uniref:rhamnogalacturonan endolyase n=1 Tax=Dendryphion nanum TaxID=256645 RepID=A0A9P9I9Z6_9PLEO|nr:Rhamnogalacturonase B, N-terminal-domain-containing protein [Dendryphion nanum]
MRLHAALVTLFLAPASVFAAWGYTDDGKNYVIDTNANLIVKVSKTNGDMTSIKYRGVEYNGQNGKNSHVESGLGASTVTIKQYSSPNNVIKVNIKYGTLKHDLIFRYGNPNVYIFMNKADTSVTVSRYIVRIPANIFTNDKNTDTDWIPDGTPAIESGDINGSGGQTWSKHYSGYKYGRTIDYDFVGYTNANVGMYLIRSNHEKASGGPFFRSLVRRGGSGGPDLYDIYHYNMGHTDVLRLGLQGPSVLHFTDNGAAPNSNLFARKADLGWFDGLEIDGWVPSSKRGAVAGVGLTNMKSGYSYVVGLKSDTAQYWATAAQSGGAWRVAGVLPGTYTLTVYKSELEVHTSTVTITAGSTATKNTITCADPQDTTAIWRIGDWDGTPKGFLNFEDTPMKPTYMHPSDTRLANWDSANFIVGTTRTNGFPGYIWKDVNNDHLVYFKLSAAQISQSFKIRIGVTEGLAGGRPTISVNSWTGALPAQKSQGDTRSLTVGTYRGNNYIYDWTVPASAWLKDAGSYQVLKISVISGKTATGYLSPGISVDAIDMIAV